VGIHPAHDSMDAVRRAPRPTEPYAFGGGIRNHSTK
jgi:hypothetical protein